MEYPLIRFAWRELLAHRARSLAAGAGIALAVAALLAATSLRRGIERRIVADGVAQGDGLMVLTIGGERQGASRAALLPESFHDADLAALRREVPGIDQLTSAAGRQAIVAAAGKAHRALVLGTAPEFFTLTARTLTNGRWMSAPELAAGAPVCVIGQTLRAELFEAADPVGRTVRTGTLVCQVVGVLAVKPGGPVPDMDDVLVMPLLTLEREILGAQTVSAIYISNRADHSPIVVSSQVEMLMRERRRLAPGAPADFTLRSGRDFLPEVPENAALLLAALDGAAGVGFLLGGLCLMTAMFASIRDRRRALGLSVVMGASRGDVASYFLIEATLLAACAGLAGLPFGIALAYLGAHPSGLDFGVSAPGLALALLGALTVGVLFGAPPALMAAEIEPGEALRRV
jgi:putative ABC transport system permease protein